MRPAPARSRHDGRKAISARLRALAAFVALLLGSSSLGQVAHFLLVPHAICAEHGELVELHDDQEQAHHAAASDAAPLSVSEPDATESGHDHCEILARAERELALPVAPSFEIAAAPRLVDGVALRSSEQRQPPLAPLLVAPKTSPPRARSI